MAKLRNYLWDTWGMFEGFGGVFLGTAAAMIAQEVGMADWKSGVVCALVASGSVMVTFGKKTVGDEDNLKPDS